MNHPHLSPPLTHSSVSQLLRLSVHGLAALSILVLTGCGGGEQAQDQPASAPQAERQAEQPAANEAQAPNLSQGNADEFRRPALVIPESYYDLEADSVVATVNDQQITLDDVDAQMRGVIAGLERQYDGAIPPDKLYLRRKANLRRLINEELQLAKAKERGLTVDDAGILAKVEATKARYQSEEMFYDVLGRQGMSEDQYIERLRRQEILRNLTMSVRAEGVSEDDPRLVEYYEENKENFRRPEMIRLSQIYLSAPAQGDQAERDAAQVEAQQIIEQLNDGADFAELAKKHSDDPSAKNGGDLQFVTRNRMPREVDQVAFNLNVGEVSEVIPMGGGFMIIKVTDKRPEGIQTFDEVKDGIKRHLENQYWKNWLDTLRAEATVTNALEPEGAE